ncbi:MAG: hypothetical protein ABIG98_06280 [Chloroflexota bacterium]
MPFPLSKRFYKSTTPTNSLKGGLWDRLLRRHINGALGKVRSRLQGGSGRGKRRDLFKSRYTLLKGAERLADWERVRING